MFFVPSSVEACVLHICWVSRLRVVQAMVWLDVDLRCWCSSLLQVALSVFWLVPSMFCGFQNFLVIVMSMLVIFELYCCFQALLLLLSVVIWDVLLDLTVILCCWELLVLFHIPSGIIVCIVRGSWSLVSCCWLPLPLPCLFPHQFL